MRVMLFVVVLLSAQCGLSAADTVWVPADAVAGMLDEYMSETYPYGTYDKIQVGEAAEGLERAINTWMETEEGYRHSMTQTSWKEKTASFLRLYPQCSTYSNHASVLQRMVILTWKLWVYARRANIEVVDGTLSAIVFYDDEPQEPGRWRLAFTDRAFRQLYETGRDSNGMPWRQLVAQALRHGGEGSMDKKAKKGKKGTQS